MGEQMDINQHFDDNRTEILEKGVANKILEQLNKGTYPKC